MPRTPRAVPPEAHAAIPARHSRSLAGLPARPVLGIDIGGSGIKGAPVDLATGRLLADRVRIPTPKPSTPQAVAEVVAEITRRFSTRGGVGATFPGVVKSGYAFTAANVDKGWVGTDAEALFRQATGRPFTVLNDAQAAAMAEVRYGAGRGHDGLVLVLTFGTGIGSGLVYGGIPLPGIELGHLRIDGRDAERTAAANVRERQGLSWKQWASRVTSYLRHLELVLWPDLIIVGGGVSEQADKWVPRLRTRTPVVPALLSNDAGIVGAALAAATIGPSPRPRPRPRPRTGASATGPA